MDGGASTGLMDSWNTERGWSIEEQEWYDVDEQAARTVRGLVSALGDGAGAQEPGRPRGGVRHPATPSMILRIASGAAQGRARHGSAGSTRLHDGAAHPARRPEPVQAQVFSPTPLLGVDRGPHRRALRRRSRHDLRAGQPEQRHLQAALGHFCHPHRAHQGCRGHAGREFRQQVAAWMPTSCSTPSHMASRAPSSRSNATTS